MQPSKAQPKKKEKKKKKSLALSVAQLRPLREHGWSRK
jgi:hypothetical protein